MEAIESFKEMQDRYFELMSMFNRGEITKKEYMELHFLGDELNPVYICLSKINEKCHPGCLNRRN